VTKLLTRKSSSVLDLSYGFATNLLRDVDAVESVTWAGDFYRKIDHSSPHITKFDGLVYCSPAASVECSMLDYRVDTERQLVMAGHVVNCLPEQDLQNLFIAYGMHQLIANPIAAKICTQRRTMPFTRTNEIVAIVERVVQARLEKFAQKRDHFYGPIFK